ncbi:MAG: hypothetical protein U0892_00195 [Pirellulales bacterium]
MSTLEVEDSWKRKLAAEQVLDEFDAAAGGDSFPDWRRFYRPMNCSVKSWARS